MRTLGIVARYIPMAIFALMFLIGFVAWLTAIDHGTIEQRNADWLEWVIAMFGIGLVKIADSLAAIQRRK